MSDSNFWIENVSAVLITRGNRPLAQVLETLPFRDLVVWNAQYLSPTQVGAQMYGRYIAAASCKHKYIYVQDDDCVVEVRQLVSAYREGTVTCNMPLAKREEYKIIAPRVSLVGWGAMFHKSCLQVFNKYVDRQLPMDELFYREADRVFTYLNNVHQVEVPFRHLLHAYDEDRLGNQPEHLASLARIQERLALL